MTRYALLVLPAANRVYAQAGPAIAVAELRALSLLALDAAFDPTVEHLAGVPYVVFEGPDDLGADAQKLLGAHSLSFALFALEASGEGDQRLRPIELPSPNRLDEDLLTIPRYAGKTNERFTKLLVNLAGAAVAGAKAFDGASSLRLVDPLCGRGTTLHQALVYGWSAMGIEHDKRDIEAWTTFFPNWLKDKRLPHHVEKGTGKYRSVVNFSLDREAQHEGREQTIEVVCDDTSTTTAHTGKSSADVIVADLPYGVHHGSRTAGRLERRPEALLEAALPFWRAALRPGGACVLAWNRKVLDRPGMEAALAAGGFDPVELGGGPDAFAHRVDRAVERDLIAARRPV